MNIYDVEYKVGDLVCWHTTAQPFMHAAENYHNPGIILEHKTQTMGVGSRQPKWLVQWADGKRTTEYQCYLVSPEKYKNLKKNKNNA